MIAGEQIEVIEEPISRLPDIADISIRFRVEKVMEIVCEPPPESRARFTLVEVVAPTPYWKNYDVVPRNAPVAWSGQFDVSRWGLLVARSDEGWVGSAVLAHDTPGLEMLEGRTDIAVLWDIRVIPQVRRKSVGTRLFHAAEAWARERRCSVLKVETQDVNVAACRFYARQGCVLESVRRGAYAEYPAEVQLLWRKHLTL